MFANWGAHPSKCQHLRPIRHPASVVFAVIVIIELLSGGKTIATVAVLVIGLNIRAHGASAHLLAKSDKP